MINIKSSDLDNYALACIETADIYAKEFKTSEVTPVIIDSLRGAHPIVLVVDEVLKHYGYDPKIFPLPTSGFVKDRVNLIHDGLLSLFTNENTNGVGNYFFIDTMISGSALRNFKSILKGLLSKRFKDELSEMFINFSIVGIKEDGNYKGQYYEQLKGFGSNTLRLKHYFVNMGKIISEDVPELLGIDYPYQIGNGVKLPITMPVRGKEDIMLEDRVLEVNGHCTSELFLSLVNDKVNHYLKVNH